MAKKAILIESTLAQYTAEEFSFLQTLFYGAGILGDSTGALGLAVSQRGAGANMSVDVSIGNALITFLKNSVTWKIIGLSSAIENVVIAANASGSNRVDAIIMRASVTIEPNALKNNIVTIERVAGSGVSALSDAAIQALIGSDAFIRLANVTVPNAAASIVNANIADTRVQVKTNEAVLLGPKVINFTVVASDPTTLVEGMVWYNSTTHELKYRDNITTRTIAGITSDAVSQATSDQSQTTQNGSVEVGEANTTTKKNKLEYSFIPTKSKMRGVKMYKLADTGAFTGTFKVALQADSSGSPSGSDLASVTLTNAQWLGLTVGEFTALFSSEYSALTIGSLYWIVITTSTSDSSNHPNLGTNTAGGYASGSVKYWNTTDGHVAIATIDLYFKTLEGIASQIPKTNALGKIPSDFLDDTSIPALNRFWDWYGDNSDDWVYGGMNSLGQTIHSNSSQVYIGTRNAYGSFEYVLIAPRTIPSWSASESVWFGPNIITRYVNGGSNAIQFDIMNTSGTSLYTTGAISLLAGAYPSFYDFKGVSSDGINGFLYMFTYQNTGPVRKLDKIVIAGNATPTTTTYTLTQFPTTSNGPSRPYSVAKYTDSNRILINDKIIDFVANTTIATITYSGQGLYASPTNFGIDFNYYILKSSRVYDVAAKSAFFKIMSLPGGGGI